MWQRHLKHDLRSVRLRLHGHACAAAASDDEIETAGAPIVRFRLHGVARAATVSDGDGPADTESAIDSDEIDGAKEGGRQGGWVFRLLPCHRTCRPLMSLRSPPDLPNLLLISHPSPDDLPPISFDLVPISQCRTESAHRRIQHGRRARPTRSQPHPA